MVEGPSPRLALAAALLLAVPLAARAQQAPATTGNAGQGAAAAPVRVTQDELVERALARSGAAGAARARAAAADAQTKSLRGRLLPQVNLSDELQRWDSPFVIPIPPPGGSTARDQTTNTFVAAVGQPLLGLLHLGSDLSAQASSARAAEADLGAVEASVKEAVQVQLLQLFEARALGQIGEASVAQLEEQLGVARARLAAGAGTRADELRLATALANARQSVIQAQAQAEAQRAALRVAIGVPAEDASVDFADPTLPEPGEVEELPAALRLARERRAELTAARLAVQSAEKRVKARTFDLLPEVNAEAAYLHVTGQSFQPENASFIGLKAEWPIWDWGARWYARSAAVAQADAASAQQRDVADRISAEVAGRLSAVRASASAVTTARAAIASAEEAYRVTDALVKAGSATTTDLLDAQSALTTARQNLTRARYAYALTRVNLARSTGAP